MSNEFIDLIQIARTSKELLSNLKSTLESNFSQLESEATKILSDLDELQQKSQEKSQEKGNREHELSNVENEIQTLDETRTKTEKRKAELLSQIQEEESLISGLVKKVAENETQKENKTTIVADLRSKITSTKDQIDATEKEIATIQTGLKVDLLKYEELVEEVKKEVNKIRAVNAAQDFLLQGTEIEIPEIDIIAAVLNKSNKEITIDELKALKILMPAIVIRTVKQLANANIFKFDENTNIIKM